MIIPKKKISRVFSDDPKADRKKEVEALLTQMSESFPNYDDPEPTANEHKGLHQVLCGFIMWVSIIGTLLMSAGGAYYLAVPRPLVYVTTQNGTLHLLHPFSIQ